MNFGEKNRFLLRGKTRKFIEKMTWQVSRESDADRAFSIAEWIGRFLAMNSCGIYRFDDLEQILAGRLPKPPEQNPFLMKQEIHLASEIYTHGGHTRLIQNLLDSAGGDADVLVVRQSVISPSILKVDKGRVIPLSAVSSVEQAWEIMNNLVSYRNIFVHIHPDDIVSAAALKRLKPVLKNSKIIFVNHADHLFSFGLASADIVFEISSYGWALRGRRKTEEISSFIGIPLMPSQTVDVSLARRSLIVSGGDAYKFKPTAGASIQKNIKFLLRSNHSLNAVIIGPCWYNYWWWSLRLEFGKRLALRARLPYKAYVDYLATCSVYLDSYPVTGGTAFTEALTRGCNVAGMIGPISGYGVADELKSKNIFELNELVQRIEAQHPETIERQAFARERAIAFHSSAAIRKRISQTLDIGVMHPLPFSAEIPGSEPWFDILWLDGSKVTMPGFSSVLQVGAVLPIVLVSSSQSFGLLRARFFQIFLKAAYSLAVKGRW